jgi:hypothetical protein
MKFKLCTSGDYSEQDPGKTALEELGFKFEPYTSPFYRDDRFLLSGSPVIEINTLQELMQFVGKFKEIVIKKDSIEIYNDYRE